MTNRRFLAYLFLDDRPPKRNCARQGFVLVSMLQLLYPNDIHTHTNTAEQCIDAVGTCQINKDWDLVRFRITNERKRWKNSSLSCSKTFGVLAVARSTFSSLALCSAYWIFYQEVMGRGQKYFLWQSRWLWFQHPYFRVEWWYGLWLNAIPYLPVGFGTFCNRTVTFCSNSSTVTRVPVLPRPRNSQWWYSTDTSRQTDILSLCWWLQRTGMVSMALLLKDSGLLGSPEDLRGKDSRVSLGDHDAWREGSIAASILTASAVHWSGPRTVHRSIYWYKYNV